MSVLISILITFLVIVLILYLIQRLPIEARIRQIVQIVVIVIGIIALLSYLAVFWASAGEPRVSSGSKVAWPETPLGSGRMASGTASEPPSLVWLTACRCAKCMAVLLTYALWTKRSKPILALSLVKPLRILLPRTRFLRHRI